ncbi:MAG: AhpC/TSA family protein [Bacteroidia bacterium]|nr:AhpC/TSA family protein [Bacteroidia bacterium]
MKNLKYILIAFSIVLLFSACSSDKSEDIAGFVISGTISNGSDIKQVSIQELTTGGLIMIDTASLEAGGKFTLQGKLSEKTFCILRFQKGDIVLLVDSNSRLNLNIDAAKIENYQVENSPENQELKELFLLNSSFMAKSQAINERFASYSAENITPDIELSIKSAFDSLQQNHQSAVKEFVAKSKESLVPYFAVNFLLPEADANYLNEVDKKLYASFSESKYAIQLHQKLERLNKIAEGAVAPDIVLSDPYGKKVSLSELRGKIVLVDFWASWCGPCRMENPKNVELYNKYKKSGFEIFGVRLDDNRDAWIAAINKDKLLWPHGSDLLKWNSSVVSLYNISAIPYTVLVDKEGKILAKELRGKELEIKLKEIFGY